MEKQVEAYLSGKGFQISTTPMMYIDVADDWYSMETIADFHKRTTVQGEDYELQKLNFAKRACSDEANLCEVIEINCGEDQTDSVMDVFEKNRFDVMYREQLERVPANGTVAAYIYLEDAVIYEDGSVRGGKIRINYIEAKNYIPLTIVNKEVVEAAFCGVDYVDKKKRTILVMFTLEKGLYKSTTVVWNDSGKVLDETEMQLGDVKPFAVLQNAEVNPIKNMEGYGFPKVYGAVSVLKVLDLCFNILFGDLDKGDKLLLVNELLCKFDEKGNPIPPNEQMKKVFTMFGSRLPSQEEIIKEYNPNIRIDEITKTFELCLSLLSMMFGFGTKQYKFENGQIQTATQYIGERQDKVQELNRQRKQAIQYITDLVRGVMWFSNTYLSTTFKLDEDVIVDFDDSFIEDKVTKLESMRQDALTLDVPIIKKWYIMERYSLTEEQARKYIDERVIEEEEEDE